MEIKITNLTHPMELDVVAQMLKKEGLKPRRVSHTELRCKLPAETWLKPIQEAVHFMTECAVEKV